MNKNNKNNTDLGHQDSHINLFVPILLTIKPPFSALFIVTHVSSVAVDVAVGDRREMCCSVVLCCTVCWSLFCAVFVEFCLICLLTVCVSGVALFVEVLPVLRSVA